VGAAAERYRVMLLVGELEAAKVVGGE